LLLLLLVLLLLVVVVKGYANLVSCKTSKSAGAKHSSV
jgi:hypothetical protein